MPLSCKRSSAAFWITLGLVVVLLAYPLSFGPACWIASRSQNWRISTFYWLIQTYVPHCPGGQAAVTWYAKLFVPADSRGVLVPFHDRDGNLAWARYGAAPPPSAIGVM